MLTLSLSRETNIASQLALQVILPDGAVKGIAGARKACQRLMQFADVQQTKKGKFVVFQNDWRYELTARGHFIATECTLNAGMNVWNAPKLVIPQGDNQPEMVISK